MVYASQPADLVYALTKSMIVNYDAYKDGAPGAAGPRAEAPDPDLGRCPITRARSRRSRKPASGRDEHEAHNQALIKRQDDAGRGLGGLRKANPPDDKEAFRKAG